MAPPKTAVGDDGALLVGDRAMLRGATVALVCSSGDRSIKVLDYETGTTYFSFADSAPAKGGILGLAGPAAMDGLGGAGDYVVSSQVKDHSLVFHKWGKTQPLFKCKTSEALGPITATPDGLFVVAGGASGKMYMWEVATGSLIKSWDGHFKAVTSLAATQDGFMLVSGSEDTLVRVWPLAQAVDSSRTEGMRPLRSWSGHSLPVTAVHTGLGGPSCRVVSVSLDQTAQVYDLLSTSALHTLRCQQGLTATAMDAAERRLALGGVAGGIFMVDLNVVAMAKTAARAAAVVVGAGAKAVLGTGDAEVAVKQESLHELVGHNKPVTALSFSWDGKLLVSASEDGTLRTWDLESHQCIRRLSMEGSGPVHATILIPKPLALTQPPSAKALLAPVQPFKKHRVEGGPSRPTQHGGGDDKNSAGASGDVVVVGGGRRKRSAVVAPTEMVSSYPTRPSSTSSKAAISSEPAAIEAGVGASAPVADQDNSHKGTKAKQKKGKKGGGASEGGAVRHAENSWEETRSQLEAEVLRLQAENDQWQSLTNHLWKRFEGDDEEEEEDKP